MIIGRRASAAAGYWRDGRRGLAFCRGPGENTRMEASMMVRRFACLLLPAALLALSSATALAQAPKADSPELAALVEREFGPRLKIVAKFPPIEIDLDGDGKPDLALVARGAAVVAEADAHDVQVISPYMASFGFGDATMATAYNTDADPLRVLIIHDWRAAKPKAKYMVVAMPVEKLMSGRIQFKKKKYVVLENLDVTGVWGALYFDGKKYRWIPISTDDSAFDDLSTVRTRGE